eukprot:CAMPEP_0119122158 /NCGR_PEP_ID=MMETSP1310-20130426/2501_1 /TAXON_ID=464262 /ORGANISM="Genus nov. species nov., Strain RCC2339" /LENGTH=153 /DNA_ID=CAMNT_0007111775 /DNA_START=109 /DNA_END=570 /DNA_ORIENTATION=+
MSGELPEGWSEGVSRKTGKVYYFNESTGKSQWEFPSEPADMGDKVRASHILVKHVESRNPSSWKEAKITRSKEEAITILQDLRTRIVNKEINFADLAKLESHCGSASRGGDLGWFGRGDMQKPFEEATYGLEVNEMSGIVDTASGVHIIRRTG